MPFGWALYARAPKPAIAAIGRAEVVEIVDFAPNDIGMPHDDGLRNSVARLDGKRFFTRIEQDDHEFAAIIGIDSARRVEHRNAMVQSQATARPDFNVIMPRNTHAHARVNEHAPAARYRARLSRRQIIARRIARGSRWNLRAFSNADKIDRRLAMAFAL